MSNARPRQLTEIRRRTSTFDSEMSGMTGQTERQHAPVGVLVERALIIAAIIGIVAVVIVAFV